MRYSYFKYIKDLETDGFISSVQSLRSTKKIQEFENNIFFNYIEKKSINFRITTLLKIIKERYRTLGDFPYIIRTHCD